MPLDGITRVRGSLTRRTRALAFLFAASILPLVGCGDSNGPSQTVGGTWKGDVGTDGGAGVVTVTLTLAETAPATKGGASAVTGSGALSSQVGEAIAVQATGTFQAPNLSLTISAPGFSNMNLTATVNGNSMNATLNGSGFAGTALTLTRQNTAQ